MKKIIVLVAAVCLVLVGFSEKVLAGPAPLTQQEISQLNRLADNGTLLPLKAGGSFPNAPMALAATEESALKNLAAGSPDLTKLKAGDGAGDVLVWVIVICVCVVLLRIVNII